MNSNTKAQGVIRATWVHYSSQHILRGHESGVYSAHFSPDGKTVVTASGDQTARLWRCTMCRPVDELAAELQEAIGRDLTDEERRRFDVPGTDFAEKP